MSWRYVVLSKENNKICKAYLLINRKLSSLEINFSIEIGYWTINIFYMNLTYPTYVKWETPCVGLGPVSNDKPFGFIAFLPSWPQLTGTNAELKQLVGANTKPSESRGFYINPEDKIIVDEKIELIIFPGHWKFNADICFHNKY